MVTEEVVFFDLLATVCCTFRFLSWDIWPLGLVLELLCPCVLKIDLQLLDAKDTKVISNPPLFVINLLSFTHGSVPFGLVSVVLVVYDCDVLRFEHFFDCRFKIIGFQSFLSGFLSSSDPPPPLKYDAQY